LVVNTMRRLAIKNVLNFIGRYCCFRLQNNDLLSCWANVMYKKPFPMSIEHGFVKFM
jgi:hypothetical protein